MAAFDNFPTMNMGSTNRANTNAAPASIPSNPFNNNTNENLVANQTVENPNIINSSIVVNCNNRINALYNSLPSNIRNLPVIINEFNKDITNCQAGVPVIEQNWWCRIKAVLSSAGLASSIVDVNCGVNILSNLAEPVINPNITVQPTTSTGTVIAQQNAQTVNPPMSNGTKALIVVGIVAVVGAIGYFVSARS